MKNRLDKEWLERNLVPSRTKAQELINSNLVLCNGEIISKSNHLVSKEDKIEIIENDKLKYVSRGGLKLEKAINEFNIDFTNLKVMDIGSSTGGFCDCALKHNAKSIIAIDVGTNLLHESLRDNKQIELHEQTNFKTLDSKYFKDIDIVTCDVSFISLKQIIDKIYNENIKIDLVCLIKPQFECGKEMADKYKGVPLNKEIHFDVINKVVNSFKEINYYLNGLTNSPIKGGNGNIEYLAYFTKHNCNININYNDIIDRTFKNM